MVRSLLLTFTLLLLGSAAFAQTMLQGKVTDATKEPLIGATVKVLRGTNVVRGAITDIDGNFRITVDPGKYDVEVSYTGFAVQRTAGVQVITGQLNFLNLEMSDNSTVLGSVEIKEFKVPLIKQDQTSGGQTLTSDQIKNLPTRSVNAIVATTAGTTSIDGGAVNIKGSRSDATNYYIDGIRVFGSLPPVQDIEQLQVVTGGLGAEYGDVTGGVISLITKGPASDYHGAIEVENSHGLDPYGWLLATANISGPILKRKKDKETLIGFRLSGQYLTQKDDNPSALPLYRAKQSVLDRLSQHPVMIQNGVPANAGETLTRDSVDAYNYRPFEDRRDIDITGKLDFRITDNIDFTVTGTYKDIVDQFTPGGFGGNHWLLLNAQNNPTSYNSRYRAIARLRHRLGSSDGSREAANKNKVSVSNASYTLQFGFERANGSQYDPRHQQNLFNYGYVGKFDFTYTPVIRFDPTLQRFFHVDYAENFTGYQAGTVNPGLAAYNEFANQEDIASFITLNGRTAGDFVGLWGGTNGYHSNINRVFNNSSKNESDVITINANSGFDLKLGKTGVHNIQFGLINEQRVERNWSVAPAGLWTLMQQQANSHFNGLDLSRVVDSLQIQNLGKIPVYGQLVADQKENTFYKEIRKDLNLPIDAYVNPWTLTPDQLRLSMFSASELNNQNLINYSGYDYLGNKLSNSITFNDFFTAKDANGVRTLPVAPQRPVYQAFYLKDKFTFNKMIFSLGMRVERFDLNTKVLRDQYSLYEIMPAKQYFETIKDAGPRPGNIGDDFKVYVQSNQDLRPKGFRNGDTWYTPQGVQVNDGNVIFGGGVIQPLLLDTISGDDIRDERFNPNSAFVDYTPQVNWLPRLAFSFPISEDANFFAHYDVLVQRPQSNWQVSPLDYYYFYNSDRVPGNNANLRPERVVDYEVGFQQKLNQNSALKFSAYYREMRDMLQERTILYVPIIGRYATTGNIDFGTVKGFTVQYDLRRVQNAELRVAYTLQFANGTGSNVASQRGLTTRGNIRALFPLDFDERHNINAILDYRFSSGKQYNGPVIAGKDILSNFGANLQVNGASGRPYTSKLRPTPFGGDGTVGAINGNRLPWRLNLDLRVDKSFALASAGKRAFNLNVYFRVSNLLNRRNVRGVYPVTGSPTDDGYLATAEGQTFINLVNSQNRSIDAYLSSYSWALLNPGRYTLPRRMYVGAAFEF